MFAQHKRSLGYLLSLTAILVFGIGVNAIAEDQKEVFTAFVINKSRSALNNTATVRISIDRWTTEEEYTTLVTALVNEGHEGFVKVLHGQEPTGFVRSQQASETVGGLPRIVTRFARKITQGDKTIINVVTDRPMRAKEDPEYKRFNVSALRLELSAEGKGEGVVHVALQVGYDKEKKQLVLKSANTDPIHLTNVSRQN